MSTSDTVPDPADANVLNARPLDAPVLVAGMSETGVGAIPGGVTSPSDVPDIANSMSRIGRNFAAVAGMGFVAKIVGLLCGVYIRRVLDTTVNGMLNWNGAFLGYVGLIANPGVLVIAKREVVKNPSRSSELYLDRAVAQLIFSVPCLLIAGAAAWHFRGQEQRSTLLLLQSIAFVISAFAIDWVYEAREQMVFSNGVTVLSLFAQVPLMLLLVRKPDDGAWYVLYPLAMQIVVIGILVHFAFKKGLLQRGAFRWRPGAFWPIFVEGLPVTLSSAAIMLYYNCDVFLLGIYSDLDTVAQYSTAYNVMLMIFSVIAPMWTAFLPRVTASLENPALAVELSRRMYRLMAIAGTVFAVFGFTFGRELVRLVYGSAYDRAGQLFVWLSLNAIFLGINTALSSPFTVWGKQRYMLWMTLISAALNFGLNLLLIPRYGMWVGVWTTLIAEAFVFGYSWSIRRRLVPFDIFSQTVSVLTPFSLVVVITELVKLTNLLPWGLTFAMTGCLLAGTAAWLEPAMWRQARAAVWRRAR